MIRLGISLLSTSMLTVHTLTRAFPPQGYSDSGKDAGRLSAAWALFEAQEKIVAVAKEYNVRSTCSAVWHPPALDLILEFSPFIWLVDKLACSKTAFRSSSAHK